MVFKLLKKFFEPFFALKNVWLVTFLTISVLVGLRFVGSCCSVSICHSFSLKSSFSLNYVHLLLQLLFVEKSHFIFGNTGFSQTAEVLHLILTFWFFINMLRAKRTDSFRYEVKFLKKSLYALTWYRAISQPVSHSVLVNRNLSGNSLTLDWSPYS